MCSSTVPTPPEREALDLMETNLIRATVKPAHICAKGAGENTSVFSLAGACNEISGP